MFNHKHTVYKKTRCTSVAQEEQSAFPTTVLNVYDDSDDDEAWDIDDKEMQAELDELRAAKQWINQKDWDVAHEAIAEHPSTGADVNLRLDWAEVKLYV